MGKQYKATIITPFHNTDMQLFQRTYDSLIAQTIGFENIEWIVVLHNCEQEYVDAVTNLLGKYDNVVLKELHNDARSASSPRNYALQFVTSPYLEFLDSDDYINPHTVEKCIEEMEKHHPDLVIFRMAYVRQDESVHSLITDVTLWNPLEKEIILTGDGLRCMELYASINLTSHPRFFRSEFIRSNQLSFDEKITMAEDGYFLVCAYSKAQKIVVLPQFIGHYYYVNNKSAVQSVEKMKPEAILHFSYGFKKIFDLLIDMHAYYNYIFLEFLAAYLQNAFSSPDFSAQDWETFQKEMAPYAKMVTPPPVNKLFSKEEGQMLYEFVTGNILTPHRAEDTSYYNGEHVLIMALRTNKDTDFGRFYHFEDIKNIEDFRKAVPEYRHKDYDDLERLDTEVGEKDLITVNKLRAYAYDFNESEDLSTVPVSDAMCDLMGQRFMKSLIGEMTFLMMESVPVEEQLNDGTYYDSSLGIRVRSAIRNYALSYRGFNAFLTSPAALIFPAEEIDVQYMNLLLALRNPEVTQLYGSNTWIIWNNIELLLNQADTLCNDIENGTFSIPHNEDSRICKEISVWNEPDPERAREVREAVKNGSKGQMLSLIWPKLKRIRTRSGGKYELYSEKITRYIGNAILDTEELFTPFGLIGEESDTDGIYKLNRRNVFFEFIPYGPEEVQEPKLFSETEVGRIYQLMITNSDGIYRMHTNIFICPVKKNSQEMWFEECARPIHAGKNYICDGRVLQHALSKCAGDMLYDYFCYYNEAENRVEVLMEPEKPDLDADYSAPLEQCLMKDDEYRAARGRGLTECRVRLIEKGTKLLWRDMRRKKFHAPADCFPPIHFIHIDSVPLLEKWKDNK